MTYLEAGNHEFTSGNGATSRSHEFSKDFLVEIAAHTASLAAQIFGSRKFNVRSLNLDSHPVPVVVPVWAPIPVPTSDLHDETGGNWVDDSLDFLIGSRSADFNTDLLLTGLVRRFSSIDSNPAWRIEFNISETSPFAVRLFRSAFQATRVSVGRTKVMLLDPVIGSRLMVHVAWLAGLDCPWICLTMKGYTWWLIHWRAVWSHQVAAGVKLSASALNS